MVDVFRTPIKSMIAIFVHGWFEWCPNERALFAAGFAIDGIDPKCLLPRRLGMS